MITSIVNGTGDRNRGRIKIPSIFFCLGREGDIYDDVDYPNGELSL